MTPAPLRRRTPLLAPLLLLCTALGLACQLDELLRAPPAPGPSGDGDGSSSNVTAVGLVFTVQPGPARSGTAISPAVEVTAVDRSGNTAGAFTGEIRVSLSDNPGDARLSGNTTQRASGGRARFTDLALDRAGAGYRLSTRADGLASATSAAFDVSQRPPSDLDRVSGDDQTDTVLATLDPYVIRARDDTGQPVAGVEIRWKSDGGSVNPLVSVTDAQGEARTVHTLGTEAREYRVTASTAELPGRIVTFESRARAGAAVVLVFTQQPTNTEQARRIEPPVVVTATDQFGNTATTYTTVVIMEIAAGTGAPGARLEGDRSKVPSNGSATFNDLKIDDIGFGYRLLATSGTLSVVSNPFNILLLGDDDDLSAGPELRR
jgi:Bacterial Ig-like domain (group 1)